jgi:hypothetical protein
VVEPKVSKFVVNQAVTAQEPDVSSRIQAQRINLSRAGFTTDVSVDALDAVIV